jgi:hypothetical protein
MIHQIIFSRLWEELGNSGITEALNLDVVLAEVRFVKLFTGASF